MTLDKRTVSFIGGGHITEIIIENLTENGKIPAGQLIVSDPDGRRTDYFRKKYRARPAADNIEAVKQADMVFINVLPQVAGRVIDELQQAAVLEDQLVVSLAAGVSLNHYQKLGDTLAVVRALPNPPSRIGMGITALAYNACVGASDKTDVEEIFASLGRYIVCRESLINAVTALSTPATVYLFFQSLVDAGVREGIDRENATVIAHQTIAGAMEMWKTGDLSPADLVSQASTPGGVSVECLYTLEKNAFRAAVIEAVHDGTKKAATFSK